jgi:hypothetical protein
MKYIITSVQLGATVNREFLKNILTFKKKHGIDKILCFVQKGKYIEEEKLHDLIWEHCEVITQTEVRLNDNLKLFDSKILPQQINPLTGMSQKLSRDYSHILPSPKIRFKSLASTNTHPRTMMTTGSLTNPNYKTHTAHGVKALEQHQFGFIFVEIINSRLFMAHQIDATKNGNFNYLNKKYSKGKETIEQPEALILGDWHTGVTNPYSREKSIAQIKELKPKRVVFHDLFDGKSINPHESGDLISELRNYTNKKSNLVEELTMVHEEVSFFSKMFPNIKFFVAESNHDVFFERYIRNKKFIDNPQNFLFVCSIINDVVKGEKPTLEIALSQIKELPSNFTFWKVDEDYRVAGVGLDTHGHNGVNGSKGTSQQFSFLNLKLITGHSHVPELHANGMCVGTNTHLRQDYMRGASSQMWANGILYKNGKYMLLPTIK